MKRTVLMGFLCCLTGWFFSCGHYRSGETIAKQHSRTDSLLAGTDTVTSGLLVSELLFYNEIADSISEMNEPFFL